MTRQTRVWQSFVLLAVLSALTNCGLNRTAVKTKPHEPVEYPQTGTFSVATFNTGLAHGAIPFADERRVLIIDALNAMTTDVLCLQEVWTDEDADDIVSALSAVYPYSFRIKTRADSPRSAKCGLFKALKLDGCVNSKCTRKGISVIECVSEACKEPYEALGEECQRCLAANSDEGWRCTSEMFRENEYVYGGRNGLLLLSRHRIERPKYTSFDTRLVKRGVISATIADRSVFCTHLTADLASVPYPGGRSYASFKEEQADQLDWIASVAPADGCTVILGDFNTGPSSETLSGVLPEHFASILAEDFVEPWSTRRCTFCKDNPLAGVQDDLQLDHIIFRHCPGEMNSGYSRVLDGAYELKVMGKAHDIRLSDHYGLRLDWETEPE